MNHFSHFRLLAVFAAWAVLGFSPLASADEGHDHGSEAAAASGTASPRLQAHSDLFELVGIVDKGRMTLYLDRYATNEPVTGAKVEFEAGAAKGLAQPQADGTYLIQLDALARPGELPFSFTVTDGADTDLLAGELSLKDPHDHAAEPAGTSRLRWLGMAAGAIAVLGALAWWARRSTAGRRAASLPLKEQLP